MRIIIIIIIVIIISNVGKMKVRRWCVRGGMEERRDRLREGMVGECMGRYVGSCVARGGEWGM